MNTNSYKQKQRRHRRSFGGSRGGSAWPRWLVVAITATLLIGCEASPEAPNDKRAAPSLDSQPVLQRSVEQRLGTHWEDANARWSAAPTLHTVEIPPIELENAIWGATGRDDHGNLYFGVSCEGWGRPAATLCRIAAGSDQVEILGEPLAELQRLGLADEMITQVKIHSKPVQANDGRVYFTSMDERGESDDGSALPICGSHLWRVDPRSGEWEHVLAAPEGLIATGCTGRYVYALGYFNHVVIQYDTLTEMVHRTVVGSTGGHISRNLLVDLKGHVYVPRITSSEDEGLEAELVELDTQLNVAGQHPLEDYGATADFRSHGIVGFAALVTGEFVFVTANGALFRLTPHADDPATLRRLGWVHPDGESYTAFLVCPDGWRTLCGISRRPGAHMYEWVIYDLQSDTSTAQALEDESQALLNRKYMAVYGSNTIDDHGNAYVVGRWAEMADGGSRPYILQARWPTPDPSPQRD